MLTNIKSYLDWLIDAVYPPLCSGCQQLLTDTEKELCTECRALMPQTNYHKDANNPLELRLKGVANIYPAAAMFEFQRGFRIRNAIHKLKYKGGKQTGIELGRWYGTELANSAFAGFNYLVPVPLHPKRLKERGYNQANEIAKGIENYLPVPNCPDLLHRVKYTTTQTKKNSRQRYQNVKEAFEVPNTNKLRVKGAKIILVDDVITTGSTIIACAETLYAAGALQVGTLALAMANN